MNLSHEGGAVVMAASNMFQMPNRDYFIRVKESAGGSPAQWAEADGQGTLKWMFEEVPLRVCIGCGA